MLRIIDNTPILYMNLLTYVANSESVIPRRYFFCGSFMFLFCIVLAVSLCASVYMCFVVTCWERAGLLALVCGVLL